MDQSFLDPVYGRIPVDPDIKPLIFSPELQRLRYIRLCNINSLYLTGASEPKRFEHSIGVYHLAQQWGTLNNLSRRDSIILRSAAILHDIQTGPFGHSFQYVLEDNTFEQDFSHSDLNSGALSHFYQFTSSSAHFSGRPFVTRTLLGDYSDLVFDTVRGEGPLGPLISASFDLDNLDNVFRLAFHSGLCTEYDKTIPIRLTRKLRLDGRTLLLPKSARSMVQRWFDIRSDLYRFLLLDRGEFSAKAMLTLAIEMAVDANLLGPDSWVLTDDELLSLLERDSVGAPQRIGKIVRRLRVGDLFEPIGVWTTFSLGPYERLSLSSEKRRLERSIMSLARERGTRTNCCLHFIKDDRKTRRAVRYREYESGSMLTVGEDSRCLHIGLFATSDRVNALSKKERVDLANSARRVFSDEGMGNLIDADEPLAPNQQTNLFGI